MSENLDSWVRQHGVAPGTPVAPYQAKSRSPWDQRMTPPPDVAAAMAEFAKMLADGRASRQDDGTILYVDEQGCRHIITDRIDGYTETVTEPKLTQKG